MNPNSKYQEIYELYKAAELRIKEVELNIHALSIPAIDQLRYAGRHLTEAVVGIEEERNLDQVKHHCQRAIYEATEAAIAYLLRQITDFKIAFGRVEITGILPNYIEHIKQAEESRIFIIENGGHEKRAEKATEILEHFQKLKDIVATLDAAREEINKKLAHKRTVEKRWVIGIIVAIIVPVTIFLLSIFLPTRSTGDPVPTTPPSTETSEEPDSSS